MITVASTFRNSYLRYIILTSVFFLASYANVFAGNTVSVNVGDQMPPIEWDVKNTPACSASTGYPNNGDGVWTPWMSTSKAGQGTQVYPPGVTVQAPENQAGYDFSCSVPGDSDTAKLVVCNNVTNQKNGSGGCMAKAPATPAAPTVSAGSCESGVMNISWAPITAATSYSLRDGGAEIYNGNGTSFTHTVANDNASHSYTLSVTTAGGTSGYSITNTQNAPGGCPLPDLVAQVISVSPGTMIRGQTTMTITTRVSNVGGANAGPFVMSDLYFDVDNNGAADVIAPGVLPNIGGIVAGSNQIITGTWLIPADMQLGANARVGFFADVVGDVFEGPGDGSWANWSGWSSSFTIAAPTPAVPSAPTATPGSCGTGLISLSWPAVADATYYTIRDGATVLGTSNTNSYAAGVFAADSVHSFSIEASNGTGNSGFSTATSGTAPSICAPATPSPFSASAAVQCGGQINLSWSPSAGAPTYYEVSSNGGASWTNVGNVTSALLQSLTPGDTYNALQVRAWNGSGSSAPANATAVASPACTVPVISAPSHSNIGQTTGDVAATITSDGGQPILDRGFCWGTASNPSNCFTEGAAGTGFFSLSLNSLNTGTTIYYRAYARNSVGTAYSVDGNFLTITATPNNPVSAIPAQPCSSQRIDLEWVAVTGASEYELFRDGSSIFRGNALTASDTGLTHGFGYNYSVLAYNANGIPSPQSTSILINAPAECIYPDIVAETPAVSTTQVRYGDTITFTSVVRNNGLDTAGPFPNTVFYIDRTGDSTHEEVSDTLASPVNVSTPAGGSHTVTASWVVPVGTPVGTTYRAGFFADRPDTINEGPVYGWDNWSGWSTYFSVVEPEPQTPPNFVANIAPATPPLCGGRVNLAWDHVAYADEYRISIDGGLGIPVGYVDRFSLDTTYGLSAGNNATIQIWAVNTTGSSLPASLVVRASNMCTDLFGTTCDIGLDQNSCNTATAMWDMTGGLPAFLIRNESNGNAVLGSTVADSVSNVLMLYGVNTIRALSDNGISRAVWAPTITCAAGLFFHPVQNVCKAVPVIDLTVIPTTGIIRSGNTADIRTRITADYDLTCSFSNNLVTGGVINHRGGVATDVTRATVPMTAGQIIQVNCRVPLNPNPVFTDNIRIEVVTEYSET